MPGKSVSTSDGYPPDRRASRFAWIRVVLWSLLIGACILWGAYVAIRLRTTYELQTRFEILHAEHMELQKRYEAHLTEQNLRLDYLEQVLFGEVLAKIDKKQPRQQPMRLEPWLANALKDIRDRLTVLERSRLQRDGSNEVR